MNVITCQRNDRVVHVPTGKRATVYQAAKDSTWAVIRFDGFEHGRRVSQAELRLLSPRWPPSASKTSLVKVVNRDQFYAATSLCNTCCHATAVDCRYFAAEEVERGIEQTGCRAVAATLSGTGNSYKVVECPRYKRGALPPVNWDAVILARIAASAR